MKMLPLLAALFGDLVTSGNSWEAGTYTGTKPNQIGRRWPVDACRHFPSRVLFLCCALPWYQSATGGRDCCVMDSQSIAGILGGIIAAVVLVIAFAYGPIG